MSDARYAAGDFVLSREGAPVGRVESILAAPSGDRLLILRAFARGSYAFAPAGEVAGHQEDDLGLRWLTLSISAEDLLGRGVFRRELGRLTRDPFPMAYGAPRPDTEAEAELHTILAEDPLTREAEVEGRVRRGVAVLEGWGGTVGGKVAAERLARTTPGVWEAVNRIVSDEELVGALRARTREYPALAAVVEDLKPVHGHVTVSLLPAKAGEALLAEAHAALERLCSEVPGVRSVRVIG